jgi:WD40 repeat protein
MYLWDPTNNGNKPVARLLGHQNKVNQVQFSPDGTLIASAGWDNSTVSPSEPNLSPPPQPNTDTQRRNSGMPGTANFSRV